MQPTSTLIGPTTDPTQTPIVEMPPFGGPLDPNAPPFDAAYWASFPPEVQALNAMDNGPTRNPDGSVSFKRRELATSLAEQGFLIDFIIMGQGAGPYAEMAQRVQNGYTWVVSALQNGNELIPTAPGQNVPGVPAYNPDPPFPPDTIVVANNLAYYLPYAPVGTAPVAEPESEPRGVHPKGKKY